MSAVTATAQMTAQEFLALPLRPEGPVLRELVEGELIVSSPSWMHNDAQGCVSFALREWTRAAPDRGRVALPLDVRLDERNVYEPDVVWYRHGRAPARQAAPP